MAIETLLYLTIVAAALVIIIVRHVAFQRVQELDERLNKLHAAYIHLIVQNNKTDELCATLRRDNLRLRANQRPTTVGRTAP
jgi:cell division protein FtsL